MNQRPIDKDIDNVFKYHAPKEGQPAKYEALREKAKEFAHLIVELCPESADRTIALRKLQETVMVANASIAIHE